MDRAKRIGIDTEPYLINSQQGIVAPRMVCLTYCTEDAEVGLLGREDALAFMHALLDADDIVFVAHHARFDMSVLAAADPTLLPKIFRAYDEGRVRCTMVREKLLALSRGELADEDETGAKRNVKFSLAACVQRRFGIDLSEAKVAKGGPLPWRLRFSELDGIPVEAWPAEARDYALDDAKWNLALFDAQTAELNDEGMSGETIPDEVPQTRGAFWLYLLSVRGVRTDPPRVNALDAELRQEYARINALVRAADVLKPKMQKGEMVWTKNMKALRDRVVLAYGGEEYAPKTEKGAVSTAREDLLKPSDPAVVAWIEKRAQEADEARASAGLPEREAEATAALLKDLCYRSAEHFGRDPEQVYNWLVLRALGERSGIEKLLKTYVPVLLQGTQYPITPTFNELVASGRTSCVAKGSLVEVVRNTSARPEGVPIEEVREGDLVYAFDDAGGLVVKPVLWAGKTGTRKVVRLHWKAQGGRSSGVLDLTDDHLVKMLGGWRKAGDILPGDRVYALRRGVRGGYWHLYATGQKEYREHNFLFSTLLGDSEHVHHKDGDKLNNHPDNLVGMSAREHASHHNTGAVRTPEQIEKARQGNIRSWRDNREYRMQAARNRRIQKTKEEVEEALWANRGKPVFAAKALGVDYSTMQRLMREHGIDFKGIADAFNAHGERIDAEFVARWREEFSGTAGTRPAFRQLLSKIGMNWYKWRAAQERHGFVPHNHVITKVEQLDAEVDVYDLTVAEVHNFIANEICVHNCVNPNLQNPPRKGGVRECFVPRPGFYYAFCDYSFIELCTLAQTCLEWFGWSAMAEAINAGLDPHLDMAASMLGIEYDEAVARKKQGDPQIGEYRQMSKALNFGFPGGLGAAKFVDYARNGYGVSLTETEARKRKDDWYKKWPEMKKYHEHFGNLTLGDRKFALIQPGSGRIRGEVGFCDSANSVFQGRAADGAKRAGWYIAKECYLRDPYRDGSGPTPLFGARPVLFVHDEFILEVPIATAHEATLRLSAVMTAGMREVVPDVKVGTEYAIASRWYKGASAVYDVNGRLVPWEPKKK